MITVLFCRAKYLVQYAEVDLVSPMGRDRKRDSQYMLFMPVLINIAGMVNSFLLYNGDCAPNDKVRSD